MKTLSSFSLMLLGLSTLVGSSQTQVLDLTNPHAYSSQTIPNYITRDNNPANNAITDLGATLGRVLFYDPRLSRTETVSCASCHQQENGFGDTLRASEGVAGTTGRHSMRLINSRFSNEERFFWDERAATLEIQSTQPIQDHIEMGFSGDNGDPSFSDLISRLQEIEEYQVLFTGVFGSADITEERVQSSLAQFVRSIQSFDSRFDEGLENAPNLGANFTNFTAQENQGKNLFLQPPPQGGAGCAGCHQPPEFSIDPNSGHNGVTGSIDGGQDLTNTRSPSLRDLVDANGNPHGGFMHDASLETLRDVINHYNAIPAVTAGLDRRLRPGGRPQNLNLTEGEKDALVAFLETLTGQDVYQNEMWSNPFDEEGNLQTVILPANGLTIDTEEENGTWAISVASPGVPNVSYSIKTSTDLVNWSEPVTVQATSNGQIQHQQTFADHEKPESYFFQINYSSN